MQQENIQQSIGLDSNFADGEVVQPDQVVNDSQENAASGQIGVAEDMLGGEGEFKARGQPKTGKANEGEQRVRVTWPWYILGNLLLTLCARAI